MFRKLLLSTGLAISLMVASLPSSAASFSQAPDASLIANGKVEVFESGPARYHVFQYSDAGVYTVTFIELENDLVIIDVGFPDATDPPLMGEELRAYADEIGKPMQIFITHDHLDHYLNLDKFTDVPVYAHPGVATTLEQVAGFKEDVYPPKIKPVISKKVGGIVFNFQGVDDSEAEGGESYIYAPKLKIFFPGDLLFNYSHMYLREYTPLDGVDELTNWMSVLADFHKKFKNYDRVFAGHGGHSTDIKELLAVNQQYLKDAHGLIKGTKKLSSGKTASSSQDIVDELTKLYPDWISGALYYALPEAFYEGDPGATWFAN